MTVNKLWKNELKHHKFLLKLWSSLPMPSYENSYSNHQLNKRILYSAIIMRKLWEDQKNGEKKAAASLKNNSLTKLSMPPLKLLHYEITAYKYLFIGEPDYIIEKVFPENYGASEKVFLKSNELLNQIIHSFVYGIANKDSKPLGFLVASDKSKTDCLYLVEFKEYIRTIEFFIENSSI